MEISPYLNLFFVVGLRPFLAYHSLLNKQYGYKIQYEGWYNKILKMPITHIAIRESLLTESGRGKRGM